MNLDNLGKSVLKCSIQEVFVKQYGHWPPTSIILSQIDADISIRPATGLYFRLHKLKCFLSVKFFVMSTIWHYSSIILKKIFSKRVTRKLIVRCSQTLDLLIKSKSASRRVVTLIITTSLIPALLLIWLFVLLRNNTDPNSIFESCMFVIPTSRKHIYIQKLEDRDVASSLGHECIHLLQNKKNVLRRNILNNQFIDEQIQSQKFYGIKAITPVFLKYLFLEIEIEARLHEILAYLYKETGFFPRSHIDLVSALMSFEFCEDLYKLYSTELDSKNIRAFLKQVESNNYALSLPFLKLKSFKDLDRDMIIITSSHKDPWFILSRYLPDCFCRLLNLYGAHQNEINFQKSRLSESSATSGSLVSNRCT